MWDLPTYSDAVDKALSPQNLKSIASKSKDADVLLGLAFLVRPGDPMRGEIADLVVKSKADYAPIAAVIAVRMDGIDDKTIGELLKSDPDNACGYYLQGSLLCQAGEEQETLVPFRKAAACLDLRLYENVTGPALFKALDALDLKGRDRLSALSRTASLSINADISAWQPLIDSLEELSQKADLERRNEISRILLLLAGHLYTTNFGNRDFAERALQSSFRLQAEDAAAEKSAAMNGYAAVTQAIISVQETINRPGFLGISSLSRGVAMCLPTRIWGALGLCDPTSAKDRWPWNLNVPDSDRATLETVIEKSIKAAGVLIDVALTDPDGIVGAYVKGLPPPRKGMPLPWACRFTYAERLMTKRPDLVKAAVAYEEVDDELHKLGMKDPGNQNIIRMTDIGLAIVGYASEHSGVCPDSIAVLFENSKYLQPQLEAKSLLSGRNYVYVAAGERLPEKLSTYFSEVILLYDDKPSADGKYFCVTVDGYVKVFSADEVKEQLQKQGKQGP